ncbi:DUF4202 domain-containing protein [Mucilaginibacter ginsenosidivorax]|uniref:DUF4202 domain-containing protein n=1 Tax=Mucilaginibacter ginsenosidivorax TaxID=862126 RepID=A0A5B8VWD4_9SPHI|nr:DUF4202 domain-containing protein [Mucilaginibacter ginsenosidivorax]QEC74538.1 DUF4202 domain-containing protein [Mucilaginibacter ginsenosidivorax]
MSKLNKAFELFDAYNKQDPRGFTWEGVTEPQEYFFAIKLYEWVSKLDPDAGEELLLASRSQHIGRWEIPREDYPEGREPYLKWRKDLALHHATIASRLMKDAGYGNETSDRVEQIILKKRIKVDADVQTMENALCLVFLQLQYEEFRKKYMDDPEKIINILRKSLLKMDSHGHQFALKLPYSENGLALINEALSRL